MGREREDGHVYFTGGLVGGFSLYYQISVLCLNTTFTAFPGFYLLSEKIGMSLKQTHEPVPYFNEKLLKSVERTLKRFEPHQPFERTSWGEFASDCMLAKPTDFLIFASHTRDSR